VTSGNDPHRRDTFACQPGRRAALAGLAAVTLQSLTSPTYAQALAVPLTPSEDVELVVYSTTDQNEVEGLLAEFVAGMPGVHVRYHKMNSDDLYDLVIRDEASGGGTADLVWSSAMDLQMKLVNDGYAQRFVPTDPSHLSPWAAWREQAYGVTAEPVIFVYNRTAIAPQEVPRSHSELRAFLERNVQTLRGRVGIYDPERSGSGLLFLAQDAGITPRTWDLVTAIGRTEPKLFTTSSSMLEGVSSGRLLLAYNVIGSYAMARSEHDPALGLVIPSDYAIILARIAFIPKAARRPELGKALLDFLLSRRGQTMLAERHLGSVRDDVTPASSLLQLADPARAQPIHIGPALLAYMDRARRANFLRQWHLAIQTR